MKKPKKIVLVFVMIVTTLISFIGSGRVLKGLLEEREKKAGRWEEWDDSYGTKLSDLKYGSRTNNTFDLYIPKGKTKNGLLLFIHGGAWMGGDKQWMEYACRRYAKMGYASATMNYSFINDKKELGTMPIMDEEVKMCLQSIVGTLNKYGVRVNNLAVGGHSAGAQIAAVYAMKHINDSPIQLRFAIIESGVMDMVQMFPIDESKLAKIRLDMQAGKTETKERQEVDGQVYIVSGVKMKEGMYHREQVAKLYATSSAASLVTSNSIPVIMAYGAKDWLVKPEQYLALENAYKKFERPYTLIVYPNSGHELDGDGVKTQELQETVKLYIQKYFIE